MKLENILNYLNTASPEQVDLVRKHIGTKKQAVLLYDEYQSALDTLKRELDIAKGRLKYIEEDYAKDLAAKKQYYITRAASMGLPFETVLAIGKKKAKKPRESTRKWRVVTPIARDTRTFKSLTKANEYRKIAGGYLYNTESQRTYFVPKTVPLPE